MVSLNSIGVEGGWNLSSEKVSLRRKVWDLRISDGNKNLSIKLKDSLTIQLGRKDLLSAMF